MKRASASSPIEGGRKSKQTKQQSLKASFTKAKSSPATVPVVIMNSYVPYLDLAHTQDLESAFENYCQNWGMKCWKESNTTRGGIAREEVDLDARGMHIVATFKNTAQLATAQGAAMAPQFIEALVLVMRNDIVHKSSHVSRAAQDELLSYLKGRPYAKLGHYSGKEGLPKVLVTPPNVWLPIGTENTAFTSKYLLNPDMSIAGRNYYADHIANAGASSKRQRGDKFDTPLKLLLHCIEKALQSAEVDFNGDLELMEYLLVVMEQDLDARLKAHEELEAEGDSTAGRRGRLLSTSLCWRVFVGEGVKVDEHRDLVRSLVQLIIGDEDSQRDIDLAEEEPEDDAPAGACIFTGPELAALGARMLRLMLRLFGTAEASGAFLSTGAHRIAQKNYRMALDTYLLEVFWSEKGVCKHPAAARSLLFALPPRDRLRLLGLVVAQKFTRTYDASSLGNFGRVVGDLAPYMQDTNGMLTRGTDLDSFFQVDLCPIVASLHREPTRAAKTYKCPENLAVLLAAVAAAAHALAVQGEQIPTGKDGIEGLKKELETALAAVAGLVRAEKEEGGAVRLHMSKKGISDLTVAQMALAAM